jgi:site-specific recombinase XerD
MSKQSSRSGPAAADDLAVHLTQFIATLAKAGYAEKTRHDKERLIKHFIRWGRRTGIAIADADEDRMEAFLACPSRRRYKHRTSLYQFVQYLRRAGVVPPRHSKPSPGEMLIGRYVNYLRDQQGLSPYSVAVYSPFARGFVTAQRLPESAAALDASAIHRYLLDHGRGRSASFVKLLAAALRSFLRFCFVDSTTAADLSTAVLPVRRWQLAAIPPFLAAEKVEHVLAVAATKRSTPRGCRAFAILLLLARLGLRASEVLTLDLDDIRWDVGEIVVRGKGRLRDRLPLLEDVGEALALYLREARGPSKSRRVFLRHIAPRVGLSQPCIVAKIAREALQGAGLLPRGRSGGHIFRHSLATRMIQHGASLAEIAQVLRHRSTITTQLYAKVEFEALRGVALPWPTAEVSR